jgi:3-dehydroquinate dehydratase-2
MTRYLLVNGPNLSTLGTREPEIYGTTTLKEIVDRCRAIAREANAELAAYQSNHEGALIDFLQGNAASEGAIINPGGLAHTSIVLRDAIAACRFPVVEVHISDVTKREQFRHHSYLKDVTAHQIVGMGVVGYEVALRWLIEETKKK